MNHAEPALDAAAKLAERLAASGLAPLTETQGSQFARYLDLLLKWNARLNLTAIRDVDGILARHFVECIACAQALPHGLETLLDLGSGAGFPGLPIAICRPEIAITLAESQNKKAAFLQEATRTLGLSTTVYAGRAEKLEMQFDCVTLRAVERMEAAMAAAVALVKSGGWLALMTTLGKFSAIHTTAGTGFNWREPLPLPGGEERILALGMRIN